MFCILTLGIMGYTGYEVTMTVIIVGPILLALGDLTVCTLLTGTQKKRVQRTRKYVNP